MIHNEIKNRYHQKKRKTTTVRQHKTEKNINFEDIYISLNLNCIHRQFRGDDVSLLAIFCVFELLHNFNSLIVSANELYEILKKPPKKPPADYLMHWDAIKWYEYNLKSLEEGKIYVRPEVWEFVRKKDRLGFFLSDKKKEKIEKQAAQEALNMLIFPKNILSKIKLFIEDNNSLAKDFNHQYINKENTIFIPGDKYEKHKLY